MRDPQDGTKKGTLYRLAPDGRCTAMVAGLVTSNGLAFSPDGRILYHSDSHPSVRTVWAWDFDVAEGRIANRRVFIDTHGMKGRPDGGCCDPDGCYWMTGNDGWEILRLTPAARSTGASRCPSPSPAWSPSAAGSRCDLHHLDPPLRRYRRSTPGRESFAVRPGHGITGIAEPRFKG
jgi:Gluconolactonase